MSPTLDEALTVVSGHAYAGKSLGDAVRAFLVTVDAAKPEGIVSTPGALAPLRAALLDYENRTRRF